jgi:hypothetical protein
MITVENKRFQVALWTNEDRAGPGFKLQFDSLAEAVAEFDRHRGAGLYRSGILYEWHKVSALWELIDRFPK